MKKQFCQSCGMPLEKAEDYGTEKDGSASTEYCHYCYQNGEWTQPDITLEETIAKGHEAIDKMDINAVKKFFFKAFCPMQIKGLKRWKA
ncbi:MAG: zinc ribbon domain-containing protein [Streptococcaceae bacterium]|nr:zinc ribbon domain-containing protein [Streptococcaceae bacterium]